MYRMYVIGLEPIPEPEMKRLIDSCDFCAISETGRTFEIGSIITVHTQLLEASPNWVKNHLVDVGQVGQQFKIAGYEANGRICLVEHLKAS